MPWAGCTRGTSSSRPGRKAGLKTSSRTSTPLPTFDTPAPTQEPSGVGRPKPMKVLLFGMIAEKAGATEVEMAAASTHDLKRALEQRIPGLGRMSYALAVDRRIVKEDASLTGKEEIALLPPFAG